MARALIRHLRLHCRAPTAQPVRNRDGILAVAAIAEPASLARLLLIDMCRWGRNDGASVTDAIDMLAPAAHGLLVAGFGIALAETQVVEWNGSGAFDLVCGLGDGRGVRHERLFALDKRIAPRSRYAFLSWAGATARDADPCGGGGCRRVGRGRRVTRAAQRNRKLVALMAGRSARC